MHTARPARSKENYISQSNWLHQQTWPTDHRTIWRAWIRAIIGKQFDLPIIFICHCLVAFNCIERWCSPFFLSSIFYVSMCVAFYCYSCILMLYAHQPYSSVFVCAFDGFVFFLFLPYTSAVPWLFYSFFFVVVVVSSEIVGHDARIVLVCAMHSLVYVSLSHSAQPHHLINTLANVVVVAIIMSNSRHLLDFVAIYLFYFFWLSVCPSVYYPFTQQ